MIEVLGIEIGRVPLLFGLFSGLVYGLLAIGLVLVYRSSKFINFSHGEVGAFGAAVLSLAVVEGGVPYWIALPIGLVTSAALAAGVEVTVVRRLARAPKLMSMVATIGAGQFLFLLSLALFTRATQGTTFPRPPGFPDDLVLDNQRIDPAYLAMCVLAPVAVIGLTVFFRRSRFGLAIRAAAANPDAAAMAGMSPQRLSTLAWALAGGLSCLTASLLLPTLGALGGASLGLTLLLRALAAAVIGRMSSLPMTFAAGIGIGVVEQLCNANTGSNDVINVVLFGIVLVALLVQARPGRREDEKGSWAAVQPWAPLPEQLQQVWLVRRGGLLLGAAAVLAACFVPRLLTNADTYSVTNLLALAIVGISLYVITGLGGQLSLGQFGIAAAGAVAVVLVADATGSYELGMVAAVVTGAVVSVLVGLPALRVQGLLLAVTTLAFALAMSGWVLKREAPLGLGSSRSLTDVSFLGQETGSAKPYFYVALAALVIALLVGRNLRQGDFGRVLVALRDNEDAARAFAVPATLRKLQGYAVAGGLAGLGGAVYACGQSAIAAASFPATFSTTVVVLSVVGGVGLLAGPVLGAFIAVPLVFNVPIGVYAAITLGWVTLVLACPGGIAALLRPARERAVDLLARLSGVDPVAARRSADPALADVDAPAARMTLTDRVPDPERQGEPLLVATGLTKRYGGLVALSGVDLEVRRGEVLGLIGPNGAGKTTLFECLSGFVRVDEGSIAFDGTDVTRWSPERRAGQGLIRSFQDSALFATMTVLETVRVAGERSRPARLHESLLGFSPGSREREEHARDLVALLGLDRYRHTQVGSLSTGTRRIAELACLVSLQPTLLLLDEPASGVAQREVEALGQVLLQIRRHLDATLVVIEHDIPMVSSIADRMVAMETGTVLLSGTPDEVLTDPRVVESYLGGDPTAVARSTTPSPAPPAAPARRKSVTVGPTPGA